jgi:hypothetical protein
MEIMAFIFTPGARELREMCFREAGYSLAAVTPGGTLHSEVVSSGLRHGEIKGVRSIFQKCCALLQKFLGCNTTYAGAYG